MPRQHCQLSHRKWSQRLRFIWNAPPGGKSEIASQRFVSILKAVGRILLVRELLILCYMTGLARVQVQYSAFVIPFVERRHSPQWDSLLFSKYRPGYVRCTRFRKENSGLKYPSYYHAQSCEWDERLPSRLAYSASAFPLEHVGYDLPLYSVTQHICVLPVRLAVIANMPCYSQLWLHMGRLP